MASGRSASITVDDPEPIRGIDLCKVLRPQQVLCVPNRVLCLQSRSVPHPKAIGQKLLFDKYTCTHIETHKSSSTTNLAVSTVTHPSDPCPLQLSQDAANRNQHSHTPKLTSPKLGLGFRALGSKAIQALEV